MGTPGGSFDQNTWGKATPVQAAPCGDLWAPHGARFGVLGPVSSLQGVLARRSSAAVAGWGAPRTTESRRVG